MKTYAVVMAAGKGTRMKSDKPKVVHEVLYKPMVCHIVDELKGLGVGSAMTYSLYKPIAEENIEKIKSLMHIYKYHSYNKANYYSKYLSYKGCY